MKNPVLTLVYQLNGKRLSSHRLENDHYKIDFSFTDGAIRAKLTAKKAILLKSFKLRFDHEFLTGDVFFGNGYQAWTTSREYSENDRMKDMIPLAATRPLKELAGISSDWRFVKFPENPGEFFSHTYTYIRNGDDLLFIGSLSEATGFTVIFADYNRSAITVCKDVDGAYAAGEYDLLNAVILRGGYDEVFDSYFKAMGLKKPRVDHMSGYTSWYNYFQKINEDIILRDLNALDRVKESVTIFQVDDGYETFVGDWLDQNSARFPHGMKYIAEKIHEKGYMAGIWLAPFSLQKASRTYREHPDWIIKGPDGKPLLGCVGWGGAYTMDIYHPEARAYMKHFFDVVLNKWGYDMVKLDFLYSQCMYPRNGRSRGQIMCEAMAFLRECCGDKLILGCGVHHGASFGYIDACRISCDVDLKYAGKFYNKLHVNNEIPSAQNAITNAIFRRHLDGRAFCNDPDVFFLRYSNLEFTMDQKLLLAGINHICGNVLFVSDNVEEYTDRDIEIVKDAFAKSDIKVLSAGYVTADDVELRLLKNGEEMTLAFNMTTGKSNIAEVMGW